ncbi:phage DNA ejection protein [Serratia sp. JSRIV002]|uniref:phage DNA ejection protein n=1 Tax=Serratia sp. JSRIV002 TaxID=2831894 RepID=UPI001CBC3F03|nr:phage DNA ejection protein [Serratia sp. JSRIV002]UAN49154.1 phage DNA ejection protein [Serratia sp. JSRIV002]
MVDPIDYSGGNGFLQGLQTAGAYQQVQQQRAAAEQAQQQQAALQQFQKDWQTAYSSGDPKQLDALVAKYPGQMETIKNGLGLRDSQHQQAVNGMANDLAIARQIGTPQALAQALSKHPETLQSIGSTPQEAMQMAIDDPQGFDGLVQAVRLSTMPAEKQFDVKDKAAARGISQQNANTSAFSAQQSVRQGDERIAIDRYKAQTGNDLAAEELKLKATLGKAQNDTARANLQQKLDALGQARNEKINSVAGSVADFGRAATVGTELGALVNQHPTAVSRAQGGTIGWAPNWADDTRTLASKTDEYNLKVVLPALRGTFGGNPTEGERSALMQSSNNMKKATSNAAFLKELDKAQNTIVQMQKRQISSLGIPVTRSQDESTDTQMLLSDPSLVEEYIRAHGYLPEEYYKSQLNGAK